MSTTKKTAAEIAADAFEALPHVKRVWVNEATQHYSITTKENAKDADEWEEIKRKGAVKAAAPGKPETPVKKVEATEDQVNQLAVEAVTETGATTVDQLPQVLEALKAKLATANLTYNHLKLQAAAKALLNPAV